MTKEAKIISLIGAVTLVLIIAASIILGKSAEKKQADQQKPADPAVLVHQDSHQTDSNITKVTVV